MKVQFEQSINEKNNLVMRLEKSNKEKNNMLTLLNNKNELFNLKLTNQSSLSNRLISEGKNNQISKLNLVNIIKKYNNLRYENKDLETKIMKQEEKINELNNDLNKYSTISKKKDAEIFNNQTYINQLKETVIDLNLEYKNLKQQDNINSNKDIEYLRNQLNHLKSLKNRKSLSKINNLDNLNFSFHKKKNNQKIFNLQGKNKLKKIHINQSTKNMFPEKLNKNFNLNRKIIIKNQSQINKKSNLNSIQKSLYSKINNKKLYDLNIKNNIFNSIDTLEEKREKKQIEELKTMMNDLIKDVC
jgi:hypothetical protein